MQDSDSLRSEYAVRASALSRSAFLPISAVFSGNAPNVVARSGTPQRSEGTQSGKEPMGVPHTCAADAQRAGQNAAVRECGRIWQGNLGQGNGNTEFARPVLLEFSVAAYANCALRLPHCGARPSPSPREARTGRGPGRGVPHSCVRFRRGGAPPLPAPLLRSERRRGRQRSRWGGRELPQRQIRTFARAWFRYARISVTTRP